MKRYRIAVIAGDGIGKEVMPEGVRALDAAARRFGFTLQLEHLDWNCDRLVKTGHWMPENWKELIGDHDAIFFGATGWPAAVPDHVSLWGSLIKFRRDFDQYVVRENTEGEYSSVGGRMFEGTEREFVTQQSCFTRKGVDRILKFAFELAATRPRKHVTSATKSNGISITMPYWDERFAAMAKSYPQVKTSQYHIDGLTIQMVLNPQRFDVIVGSNLFGDILSDLGPATAGTIGIAPSANLNPERAFPSLFEPVHGSAPDIYGRGIANPIGQIWSGAMMLDHLGEPAAGAAIVAAIEKALAPGSGAPRTPDIGGNAKTSDMGKAIAEAV